MLPAVGRSWFYATELATIYNFPTLPSGSAPVIGVFSFGGGLFGTFDSNGVMLSGDCTAYWTLCGISALDHPTVVVIPLFGATNDTTDIGSTSENTLDVQTIGACCPSAKTTILLYIVPNTADFATLTNYALSTPILVKGVAVKPSVISISWGLPEAYMTPSELAAADTAFAAAVAQGVNITTATGDNGSNDGVGGLGNYTDFPSSSPNVIAVGGTSLSCPNRVYDGSTLETSWSSGGGGVSSYFAKPSYQSALIGTKRQIPDIASDADPNTGVLYIVNGGYVVYGGTSVSSPTVAGFLASVNNIKWANPVFYSTQASNFHDIVTGSNGGYTAKTGYDNITGLGSPKGNALATALTTAVVRVTAMSLVATSVNITTGRTYQAIVSVLPENATNKSVSWSSSNTRVAIVSGSGLITGVGKGSATITATTVDGNKTAQMTVTVTIPVTGVTLTPSTVSMKKQVPVMNRTLAASVQPSTASNKAVTWSSSNTNVATVMNGTVTAKNIGTTVITVRTVDGGYTATSVVTVRP